MLIGIQGSGKSFLAEKLEDKGYVVASNDRYDIFLYNNIFI